VAFDAVCTHAGCTVEWDAADRLLFCPCHGAAFDPAHHAAVIDGPTNAPLPGLSIVVDRASGTVLLQS
jgi:thiosulfate dehydrogenase [quinone] large subunit